MEYSKQPPFETLDPWLKLALEASGDLLYDMDVTSGTLSWAGGQDLFGMGALPESLERFTALIHPEDLGLYQQNLVICQAAEEDAADCDVPFDIEYRLRNSRGDAIWLQDRGRIRRDDKGAAQRLIGSLRPITMRKQREARLEHLASYDELTGLFNRNRLRDALDQMVLRLRMEDRQGAYLLIGMDKLSTINNVFGHETGDKILLSVARSLALLLEDGEIIGRIGTDRFALILAPVADETLLKERAQQVLETIRELLIETADGPVRITASMGAVLFPGIANLPDDIMAKAETVLKGAKQGGRDQLVIYRPSDQQKRLYRYNLSIGDRVIQAMADKRLEFVFQPVVDSESQQAALYECLLRLRDSEDKLVPAGSFIPVLEHLGMMREVDRYSLDLALARLENHPNLRLAMNISAMTVGDRVWLSYLQHRLTSRFSLASRLIIEVTETAAMRDIELSSQFLSALRELGCQVALDDFGSGFTSFRHLSTLSLDIVKIDGSFVRNLANNPGNRIFIRNLLSLAQVYGLRTIAEGVETSDDAMLLIDEGVQLLQGYYFGRPSLEMQAPQRLFA